MTYKPRSHHQFYPQRTWDVALACATNDFLTWTSPCIFLSSPTKARISSASLHRCVLCLRGAASLETFEKLEAGHIISANDSIGGSQVDYAVAVGLLAREFSRADVSNGMCLCSKCHASYFTPYQITWAPNVKVLQWIFEHIDDDGLPNNWEDKLNKDPKMQEYLGIYTVVCLRTFASNHVGNGNVPVPNISPEPLTSMEDAVEAPTSTDAFYWDTTSMTHPEGGSKLMEPKLLWNHYWRLPESISLAAVLVALIHRGAVTIPSDRLEIQWATRINTVLVQRYYRDKWSEKAGNSREFNNSPITLSTGLPTPPYEHSAGDPFIGHSTNRENGHAAVTVVGYKDITLLPALKDDPLAESDNDTISSTPTPAQRSSREAVLPVTGAPTYRAPKSSIALGNARKREGEGGPQLRMQAWADATVVSFGVTLAAGALIGIFGTFILHRRAS